MNKLSITLPLAALGAALAFLTGCIEARETIMLQKNGSGTYVYAVGMISESPFGEGGLEGLMQEGMQAPEAPAATEGGGEDESGAATMTPPAGEMGDMDMDMGEMLNPDDVKADIEQIEGLTFKGSREFEENGKNFVEVSIDFESLDKLKGLQGTTLDPQIGEITFTSEGGNMVYTRKIEFPNEGMEDADADPMQKQMMEAMFADAKFDFTVTFEGEVVESNGEVVEGKSAKWSYPVMELMGGKVVEQKAVVK